MPPKRKQKKETVADTRKMDIEHPTREFKYRIADLTVMEKSRYYGDFIEWLNCCREYDPEKIIGTSFEKSLFKTFKMMMGTLKILIDNPKEIKLIKFKSRGLDITYKSSFEWKYPEGNKFIYDPDQVINQSKLSDD